MTDRSGDAAPEQSVKLLADATLGRLAKWLRLLGYDTAYVSGSDAWAVMRQARAEKRLVLTRDHKLAGWRGVRSLLIESVSLEAQLQQVWAALGVPPEPATPRCPICNHPLEAAPSDLVSERLPAYVQRTQQDCSWCPSCDQLYWRGTHWQRIETLVSRLRDEASSDTMNHQSSNAEA